MNDFQADDAPTELPEEVLDLVAGGVAPQWDPNG